MAVHTVPLTDQPEFDDVGPLTSGDRLLLRIVAPFLQVWHLATAPARMHRVHSAPRGYNPRAANVAEWSALPDIARSFFEDTERTFTGYGFTDSRHMILPTTTGAAAYMSILFAPATRDLAILIAGVVPRRFVTTSVTLQTWWDDGSRLVTTNSEDAALFESLWRKPKVDGLVLRDVEDLGRIWAAHRRRAAQKASARPIGNGWNDPVDNPLELARRGADEWDQRVVEAGLYYVESDELLRFTWKGAILLTWARLEPFQSYLAWKGRRRAAQF
jgi:hypothetical protein